MEFNEISMCLDVKLDIYDKRPDSLKFKTWTKCQVKIEAIKCLPCFLRINFHSLPQNPQEEESSQLSVSINVPGVTISLATSRTKQYSYGLFWTHNRRDCFIYFALDTEMACRKHMKWIKKSIKNLELYRQVFLEQRRNSRGSGLFGEQAKLEDKQRELSAVKDALSALGPLPQIPDANNSINWSRRVSRASEIYEEIFEGNFPPRLSRRLSRTSIASGIYEEMKPCSPNIHSIMEEHLNCPPPLPPLPAHRKRLNTCESDPFGLLGDIPRSNTNPESELAKKKKYKNVLDNIFGSGRSKRAESVSETPTCTMEDIINGGSSDSNEQFHPIYANEILKRPPPCTKPNKRNSFSSPDLSKINFLDTFDEDKVAALLQLNSSSDLEVHADEDFSSEIGAVHNYSSLSLDDSAIAASTSLLVMSRLQALKAKSGSMESLNVSGQLPQNFNFSACNTSSINLIGASGAVPSIQKLIRNKIIMEDELSGYCVMAPIINKKVDGQETTTTTTSSTTSSTTSGYSTGSYCSSTSSSTSSNTQVTENKDLQQKPHLMKRTAKTNVHESDYDEVPMRKTPIPVNDTDLSNIYENMQTGSPLNISGVVLRDHENTPPLSRDFTGNLYENLLTIKAAQELEQPSPAHICTSTPTDSPADKPSPGTLEEQENFYQTPRKSIVSVDDKIPSYYPNSCDTVKMRRRSNSPSKQTTPTTAHKSGEKEKSSSNVTTMGIKHLVNIKMKRERKENLYISSPQKILEQRKKSTTTTSSPALGSTKTKKSANAQKISENVYTVNLSNKKSLQLNNNNSHNNNNISENMSYKEITETAQLKEKLHNELLQLALLQNIDFKFDDTSSSSSSTNIENSTTKSYLKTPPAESGIAKLERAELEYEHCYQASKDATRLLHKYATLAPKQSMRIKQQLQQHLQLNQGTNKKNLMTQSTKLESPVSSNDLAAANAAMGSKKFASLPRFKKIDFSPLKLKINNVLQRNQTPDF
ncbi:serine-rich adhesin for platelets [Lucilia sericata]|uniref:serine-rich adhesin for platelets n=1 Tax=Lucilia sericata TaxID=13632 RepID=UPI0018A81238|nr:serine-rich adhesin for platelets [Lucilia sericata]